MAFLRRRLFWVLLALAFAAGGGFYIFAPQIALRLMDRALASNLSGSALDAFPDGLHFVLCGAGGPLPDPQRSGPCSMVIAGDHVFVIDAGSGGVRNLIRMRLAPGRIEAIFLTHYHSDHIDGLGELLMQRWVGGGHKEPPPVYGPPGVSRVVSGFNLAYDLDAGYRVEHHGGEIAPSTGSGGEARGFPLPRAGEDRIVWERDGVKVTAFAVDHTPVESNVGYRFDYGGRSVVISGDTIKSANLARVAKGADLLVHEALSFRLVERITAAAERARNARVAKITRDILDYHTRPVEAAQIAQEAGVKALVLYHIVPPLPLAALERVFLDGVGAAYDGEVILGRDGTFISLPKDSEEVEDDNLL